MITQLNSFGITDIGCRRAENEDQYLLSELHQPIVADPSNRTDCGSLVAEDAALLAVADGLGGHNGGAIASEIAVDTLGCFAQENEQEILHSGASWKLANLLRKGILNAASKIESLATSNANKHSMSTTLTSVLIRYPDLAVGHVGDSRCYLFRDGNLQRLTKDHTVAQLYHDKDKSNGRQSSSDSKVTASPMSHMLWNSLGGRSSTDVESHILTLKPNDWIILATDGLYRHISDSEIEESISQADCPRQLCTDLKQLALERGGKDNITVVACNWVNQNAEDEKMAASVTNPVPRKTKPTRFKVGGRLGLRERFQRLTAVDLS